RVDGSGAGRSAAGSWDVRSRGPRSCDCSKSVRTSTSLVAAPADSRGAGLSSEVRAFPPKLGAAPNGAAPNGDAGVGSGTAGPDAVGADAGVVAAGISTSLGSGFDAGAVVGLVLSVDR